MSAHQPAQFTLPFTHYASLGYSPCPTIGKNPQFVGEGWYSRQYSEEQYEAFDRRGYNVGLRCENIVGLDIDVQDPKLAAKAEKVCRKVLGLPKSTPVRTGRAPKRLLVARVAEPVKGYNISSRDKSVGMLFQLLGRGKQFVVHGTHPDTGRPYTLTAPLPKRDALKEVTVEELAALRVALIELFEAEGHVVRATGAAGARTSGEWSEQHPWSEVGRRQAWEALDGLDADMPMDDWVKVGFALHDGTHGSEEGLAMWDEWSSRSADKYKPGDCERRWRGFKPGGGTRRASLFRNDWPKVERAAVPVPQAQGSPGELDGFFTTTAQIAQAQYPQRRQFIEDTIQVGCTLLHGPAKKGKSWMLLDMVDHIAHAKGEFLGRAVHQAKVLLIGAEDTPARFKDRIELMGIGASDQLITMHREQLKGWAEACALADDDGNVVPWTPALFIEALHRQTGAEMIILDTQEIVEITLGIEHGDRTTSLTRRDYMSTSLYDDVANVLGISVVLVAHWGAIKSVQLAATNPHQMINTTKTKISGALTSLTIGPLADQEMDDDTGRMQWATQGKDIRTGNRYEVVERDKVSQRHRLIGTARDVGLRDSLAEVMEQIEALLNDGREWVTSSDLGALMGMRADTVRKKVLAIMRASQKQATLKGMPDGRVFWKGKPLLASPKGYRFGA